ncbi:MAG: hypothetical protein AAB433_21680 [Nitrospirota bacterium]
MSQLKKSLFAAYNGFADKRIKNLSKSTRFIVDDRKQSDHAADKTLFLWFCSIFVDVVAEDEISICLAGGIPTGASVTAWINANGDALNSTPQKALVFSVKKGSEPILSSLAAAFEAIVAPGKKYSVPSYKYVCPRTAQSLRRLANELHAAWNA